MRFLRFSLRRLLILTALVAVLLYLLTLRPSAVAKQFIRTRTLSDSELLTRRSFGNQFTDEARTEGVLEARSWEDVLKCRQRFTLKIVKQRITDDQFLVAYFDFYATPIGVQEKYPSVLMVKEVK
jgi:hypothetical protein